MTFIVQPLLTALDEVDAFDFSHLVALYEHNLTYWTSMEVHDWGYEPPAADENHDGSGVLSGRASSVASSARSRPRGRSRTQRSFSGSRRSFSHSQRSSHSRSSGGSGIVWDRSGRSASVSSEEEAPVRRPRLASSGGGGGGANDAPSSIPNPLS